MPVVNRTQVYLLQNIVIRDWSSQAPTDSLQVVGFSPGPYTFLLISLVLEMSTALHLILTVVLLNFSERILCHQMDIGCIAPSFIVQIRTDGCPDIASLPWDYDSDSVWPTTLQDLPRVNCRWQDVWNTQYMMPALPHMYKWPLQKQTATRQTGFERVLTTKSKLLPKVRLWRGAETLGYQNSKDYNTSQMRHVIPPTH